MTTEGNEGRIDVSVDSVKAGPPTAPTETTDAAEERWAPRPEPVGGLTVRLPDTPPPLTDSAAKALLHFIREEYNRLKEASPAHPTQ
ncbi:hypothetical protein ACFY12_08565 [Streptomyces sp. NPDC001339]|uniref:hypothetical protein n=1 Tax=Streptomyces sp. NPDC001339 TaxID=3364563 RepID=UPI0036D04DC7